MNVNTSMRAVAAKTQPAPAAKAEQTILEDAKQGVKDFFKPSENSDQMGMRALLGGMGGTAMGLMGVAMMRNSGGFAAGVVSLALAGVGAAGGWMAAEKIAGQ